MVMVGSTHTKQRRELARYQKLAAAGVPGAAKQAEALQVWLVRQERDTRTRQDNRVKVLVGAWLGYDLGDGSEIPRLDAGEVLRGMEGFLIRPDERLAILGADGQGSEVFWRVFRSR